MRGEATGPPAADQAVRVLGPLAAVALLALLLVPLLALAVSVTASDVQDALTRPWFMSAVRLSVQTTLTSLSLVVIGGTPLAWWLATSGSRTARIVALVVDLPVVVPPAVVGVALLMTFGRRGLLAPALDAGGISVAFTWVAVVLAQMVVSAPFYVQSAVSAFRRVDPDLLTVARTLGASRTVAFFRVALPVARPGLTAGASLAWARALGEFGATLLFAGNLRGETQTVPLAIYTALQADVRQAVVYALVLVLFGAFLLVGLRATSRTSS